MDIDPELVARAAELSAKLAERAAEVDRSEEYPMDNPHDLARRAP